MAESNFDPKEVEHGAITPDIPSLRSQEGVNSNTAGASDGNGAQDGTGNTPFKFNRNGDNGATSGSSAVSPDSLDKAESSPWTTSLAAAGASVTGGFNAKNIKNIFWGSKSRKRRTVGGGIAGAVIGGTVMTLVLSSGAAELIQLSHILQRNSSISEHASSVRSSKLVRYATADNVGETRIGLLGRKVVQPIVIQLNDLGVSFDLNPVKGINKTTIDTEKVAKKYPELKGMSTEERVGWIAKNLPVTADQISHNGKGVFTIDSAEAPVASDKLLFKKTIALLYDGKIPNAIINREFAKFVGVGSLFHPIKRLAQDKLKQLGTAAGRRASAQQDDQATRAPIEAQGDAPVQQVKDKSSGLAKGLMSLLLIQGGTCFIRDTAGAVVLVNQDRIALPAAAEALRLTSLGAQVQSGQDITAEQVAAAGTGLTDNKGGTIWQSSALQAMQGSTRPTGTGLPPDYRQAFTGTTTAQDIRDWASAALGGNTIADVACGPVGFALGIAATLLPGARAGVEALKVGGGAISKELAATLLLKEGVKFAATGAAMHFVENFIIDKATLGKLAKDAFSGPMGGSLLAYGSRYAAKVAALSSGGVALAASTSQSIGYQQQLQDNQQFHSESLYARVFDINDYRSVAGHMAQTIKPSLSSNVASARGSLSTVGSSILSNLSSIFTPKTQAFATNYDWGSPQYGIPPDILNDPSLANPYENSHQVVSLLTSSDGQGYIDRASKCFGVTIAQASSDGAWTVTPDHPVDTASDNYQGANCNDTKNSNWRRIILFVFDTRNAQAMACYTGDDQSCQEVGYSNSASPATTNTPPPSSSCGSSGSTPPASTTVSATSYFNVNGNRICDKNGNQFVPYGVSVVDDLDEPGWQNPSYQAASDAQIQAAATYWHVNTIRLQVSEQNFMKNPSPGKSYNQAAMDRLGAEVDKIESLGKIPIINDNVEQTDNTRFAPVNMTIDFWKAVTEYFSDKGPNGQYLNVVFDIYNEPKNVSWVQWQKGGSGTVGMQDIANAIRGKANGLKNNLILVEGPYVAGSLAELDTHPIIGGNIAFAYHHVDFTNSNPAVWKNKMGLDLKTPVPIVDGEWAQYAARRAECLPKAPHYIDTYLSVLQQNHIGLILWSLEPTVDTSLNSDPNIISKEINDGAFILDKLSSNPQNTYHLNSNPLFSASPSDYSSPNSFKSNYACSNSPSVLGQGAGSIVMQYFQKYGSN